MFLVVLISPFFIFILTRNLSIIDFGVYSLLAISIDIVIVILDMGLPSFITTRLSGINIKTKISYFFSIYLFETLLLAGFLCFFMIPTIQNAFLGIFGLEQYSFAFKIALLIIVIGTFIRLNSSYFASKQHLGIVSLLEFMLKCSWVLMIILFFSLFKVITIEWVFSFWLIGMLLTFFVAWYLMKSDLLLFLKKPHFNLDALKKGIIFALPLIVFNIGSYVIAMSDRYMISFFLGNEIVAFYSLASSITLIIISVGTIVPSIIYPYLAELWNKKKDYNVLFNASLKYGLIIIIPSIFGLFVLREQIITLISGVSYLPVAEVLPYLLLTPFFSFLAYSIQQLMLLRNKTNMIAWIYIFASVLNIVLNFILIPIYGMQGAAIATTFSYFFMFILSYGLNFRFIKLNFDFLSLGRILIASIVMGLVIYLFNPQIFITKILSIGLGAFLCLTLLFSMKCFVHKEKQILFSILRVEFWKR